MLYLMPAPLILCTGNRPNANVLQVRSANVDDSSCVPNIRGCTIDSAINHNPSATVNDVSAQSGPEPE